MLLRSLAGIVSVDPGFNPDRLITFRMNLDARYGGGRANPFYQRLLEEVGALPGVESAAAVTRAPMAGDTEFLRPYRRPGAGSPDYSQRSHGDIQNKKDAFTIYCHVLSWRRNDRL